MYYYIARYRQNFSRIDDANRKKEIETGDRGEAKNGNDRLGREMYDRFIRVSTDFETKHEVVDHGTCEVRLCHLGGYRCDGTGSGSSSTDLHFDSRAKVDSLSEIQDKIDDDAVERREK